MTAFGSEDKKEEAMEKGCQVYLEKPFEMKEIRQLVMDILEIIMALVGNFAISGYPI